MRECPGCGWLPWRDSPLKKVSRRTVCRWRKKGILTSEHYRKDSQGRLYASEFVTDEWVKEQLQRNKLQRIAKLKRTLYLKRLVKAYGFIPPQYAEECQVAGIIASVDCEDCCWYREITGDPFGYHGPIPDEKRCLVIEENAGDYTLKQRERAKEKWQGNRMDCPCYASPPLL